MDLVYFSIFATCPIPLHISRYASTAHVVMMLRLQLHYWTASYLVLAESSALDPMGAMNAEAFQHHRRDVRFRLLDPTISVNGAPSVEQQCSIQAPPPLLGI